MYPFNYLESLAVNIEQLSEEWEVNAIGKQGSKMKSVKAYLYINKLK